MSHTLRHSGHPTLTVGIFEILADRLTRMLAKARQRLSLVRTRKIVSELSDAQLADAGIDRDTVLPSRPTIEVDSGLMTRLMSMR